MIRTMFFEGLQSYYAPITALLIFSIILYTDTFFSKYIRRLFFTELFIIIIIIIATWADRCLSIMDLNGMAWKLRTFTTFLNFALSPYSPMIFGLIYNKTGELKINPLYYMPAIGNTIFCILSIFTGWLFHIDSHNIYSRGPLFAIPFLISIFYLLSMIYYTIKQKNRPSRKTEAFFLTLITIAISGAMLLEVVFVIRFMIWSTTTVTVILYFLTLTNQKILYDPLTGIYSKVVYSKNLEQIQGKKNCTIAIIDLNDLKYFNDKYGHSAGNEALLSMTASILQTKTSSMRFYRCGGDEFALIGNPGISKKMTDILESAQNSCHPVKGEKVSFAFGIAQYHADDNLQDCINLADQAMYQQKNAMKKPGRNLNSGH